jgi:cleavage stimulation factor subunit 2
MSAVRNLNGQDCGGRPLRIDLADSDPFLEGKTTVRGEIVDAGDNHRPFVRDGRGDGSRKVDMSFLNHLPPGTPCPPGMKATDTISQVLATMDPQQVIEVLAHTKVRLELVYCCVLD